MFCVNCGKQLSNADLFCTNCGTKIVGSQYSNPLYKNEVNEKSKQGINILFKILLFGGGVIFLGFILFQFLPQNQKDELEKYLPIGIVSGDEKLESMLIGKWKMVITENEVTMIGTIDYNSNRTCHGEITQDKLEDIYKISFDGTWKVKDKMIFSKVDSTSFPLLFNGTQLSVPFAEKIISISENEMVTENDGKTTVYSKISE